MKVVLFCGGQGTRIRDYSNKIPKPMVPIRGLPILWHIMKYYAEHGHTDFILCCGYKSEKIINWFSRKRACTASWKVQCVDTGLKATIGDRLLAVRELVKDEPLFLANYGDGVSNVRLDEIIALNRRHDSVCTFIAVRPHISYHFVEGDAEGFVTGVTPTMSGHINGGFFVMTPEIFANLHPGEEIVIEGFKRLIEQRRLTTYVYDGFWQSCDTLKDYMNLEDMARDDAPAPWEIWKDWKKC